MKKRQKKKNLKQCCECDKKFTVREFHGRAGKWYWCDECIDIDRWKPIMMPLGTPVPDSKHNMRTGDAMMETEMKRPSNPPRIPTKPGISGMPQVNPGTSRISEKQKKISSIRLGCSQLIRRLLSHSKV